MKLVRFGPVGKEAPGVLLEDGTRLDCRAVAQDWNEAFFAHGGLERLAAWLAASASTAPRVPSDARWASCVARPSKIICIGLNFVDHAKETGKDIPTEPVIFFKATTALCGPNDDVHIPIGGTKLDWEVELAFVIGKEARHVPVEKALEYVAGYSLHNDYSERAFQLEHGGQWVKGKSCDTFAPLGPYMATRDEVPDPQNLAMKLEVNGVLRQNGHSKNMVFGVAHLVSYLSRYMTLLPGDVISTGTPAGVGLGFNPPIYLREGDVVSLSIDKLGASRQRVVQER
jgi:2-keto-4-pentenoate hydratase/2-oxohepta-3-ene-1,7-dioic acid hydratase in catechol pathway